MMKKIGNKFLAVMVAATMVLAVTPVAVLAQGETISVSESVDQTAASAALTVSITPDSALTFTSSGGITGTLYFSTSLSDITGRVSTPQNKSITSQSDSFTFNSLTPTTYYYMASATVTYDDGSDSGLLETPGSFTINAPAPVTTAPTGVTASVKSGSITENAAVITTNVATNGGSDTSYRRGVVYATTSGPTTSNPMKTTSTKTGSVDITVDGLSSNTTYYVRAFAENDKGITYSGETSFKTSTAATAPTATTAAASNTGVNSVTLPITVTAGSSVGIKERGVILSTNASNLNDSSVPAYAKRFPISGTTAGTFSVTVNYLDQETTYYYKAYVQGSDNKYYYDSATAKSFWLAYNNNLPTVKTDSTSDIAGNTATVNITVSNIGGSSVKERGVVYSSDSTVPTYNDSHKSVSGSGTGSSKVELTGLTKNTTYYVRAYATNNTGIAYGTVRSFKTSTTANIPSATTYSAEYVTAYTAEVPISISSNYDVTERGVVYSSSNDTPEVGTSKCYKETIFGTTGDVNVMLTGLSRNTKYYVRAYAKNTYGYGYGDVKTFTTESSDSIPEVETESASAVAADAIEVEINVTDDNDSSITERGVVYSKTDSNPRIKSRSCDTETTSGKTGRDTITIEDLSTNATYYVRAFATNRYGTAYGVVVEVKLGSSSISTSRVTSITTTSATVGGYVSSNINSSVKERGVVFSTSNKMPTISDSSEEFDDDIAGEFTIKLTGLNSNKTYYVRAYIRTSSGYEYGNMVEFATTGNAKLTINYRTAEGSQVGTQTLTLAGGATITSSNLLPPTGYYLTNPSQTYKMPDYDDTINVVVKRQGAYMESSSGYRFEPDRLATRIEVVRMLYALRGTPVTSGVTFVDIPADYPYKKELDFAAAMGYVQGEFDSQGNRHFRPNDGFTRAEMAQICKSVFGISAADSARSPFPDTAGHWAEAQIAAMYANGLISGYEDGTCRPNKQISRAELCSLFARCEKRELTPLGTRDFVDVPPTHWAYRYVMNAAVPQP